MRTLIAQVVTKNQFYITYCASLYYTLYYSDLYLALPEKFEGTSRDINLHHGTYMELPHKLYIILF